MRTILKIVLIMLGFIIFAFLFGITKSVNGGIASLIGILLMVGFISGAKAIWKYNPSNKNNSNSHDLDKS